MADIAHPVKLAESGLSKKGGGWLPFWQLIERIRENMERGLPDIGPQAHTQHGQTMLICGGGPSIANDLKAIRKMAKKGGKIWAVNKTHDYLVGKGLPPWGACLLDPKERVAQYIQRPRKKTRYYIASQCHPGVFDSLSGFDVTMWHAGTDYFGQQWPLPLLNAEYGGGMALPGPTTVGLRAIVIGYFLGFRKFHLFGMDSSMEDGKLHAYPKDKMAGIGEKWVRLQHSGGHEDFYTNAHMAKQALDFDELTDAMAAKFRAREWEPVELIVHGQGLLPSMAAKCGWHADKAMNIKWSQ